MVGAGMRRAGALRAAALALALLGAAGCYWQRYPRLVETHLDLMLEFSAKLRGFAEDGERIAAASWGEFTYPLERARDFSRIVSSRHGGRGSLAAFDRAVAAYAELVADPAILDRADAIAEIDRLRSRIGDEARAARAALAREEGRASVSAAASG